MSTEVDRNPEAGAVQSGGSAPFDLTGAPSPTDPPTFPHWKDEALLGPAAQGRAARDTWVWVSGASPSPSDVQWMREVTRGDRHALGGLTERWNAMVLHMVHRDGRWVTAEHAGPLAEGEQVTAHRFIAYNGVRS